jgi:hypothetical protein
MIIPINANTKLVLKQSKGQTNLFDEVYFGWPTGITVEAPVDASVAEVIELYKA